MNKEYTLEEARHKAERYCSLAERCKADVVRKFQDWGIPGQYWNDIVYSLENEKYIDERRYAVAFTRDKYRFSRWGRRKIVQELRMKQIDSHHISEALDEIDSEEYQAVLLAMLTRKEKSIKAKSDYERTGKLIRFAVGHGYEMDDILFCIKQMGGDEYME